MNVNNIKTFMIGAMVSGLTACEKPVLKKTNNPLLTSTTKEVVDSFAKESKKILSNSEYRCFAKDTIPLNFYMSPEMLERRLNTRMSIAMPQVKVGGKYEERLRVCGKVLSRKIEKVDIKEPKYIEPKVVMDNSNYYSYRWFNSAHIPVKYYGKPNPKLK